MDPSNKEIFETSNDGCLDLINRIADGYYLLAEMYHNYHLSGFSDWKGTFTVHDSLNKGIEEIISGQTTDKILLNDLVCLEEEMQKMKNVDGRITDWLAYFVGLPSAHGKKNETSLERQLKKVIENGPDGKYQGPIWIMNSEYQIFVQESENLLNIIRERKIKINERIEQLTRRNNN